MTTITTTTNEGAQVSTDTIPTRSEVANLKRSITTRRTKVLKLERAALDVKAEIEALEEKLAAAQGDAS